MTRDYDVIVVGARCAGAPTAMLLARRGHKVLLVDRAAFPSDTVSTHMVHAPGVAALRRWGLLERVAATGCPPIESYTFDFGPVTISGRPHPVDGNATAYAPRRTVLDALLIDAAGAAGAEARERFTFEAPIVEDGVVVGIRGHDHGGRHVSERARVVVGADGWHSRLARTVGAEPYRDKPMLQYSAYSYWSGLPVDGMETVIRPGRGWAALPTNDGLTMLVVGWPMAEVAAYKADIEANYLATLEMAPAFARRVRAATREERFSGGTVPNFFRRPYGPGWVLVGDAGYTRDSITAQGISDAFHDAEQCAAALDRVLTGDLSLTVAMADRQQARDQRVLPLFELTTELATLQGPPPEMQQLLRAINGNQPAMDAFASIIAGTLSPTAFFDPDHIGALITAGAAAAG